MLRHLLSDVEGNHREWEYPCRFTLNIVPFVKIVGENLRQKVTEYL